METKIGLITQRARRDPKCKFTTLAYLLGEGFLKDCFWELKKNKAPGIDGVTVREYEVKLEENLKEVVTRLKGKKYRPQPVRGQSMSKISWMYHTDSGQDEAVTTPLTGQTKPS